MYPAERRQVILEQAAVGNGQVSVALLSERLGVSAATIRRDLADLERDGMITRQHGGAQLVRTLPFELSLPARRTTEGAERAQIAREVVARLPEDGVVSLDSGAMGMSIAEHFPTNRRLVVVTNNLPAARLLASHRALTVLTLPGHVRHLTQATVDEWARERLEGLSVDVAILGANGVTEEGVTTTIPAEAAVKGAMIDAAAHRILAVTASKFGVRSFCRFAELNEFDVVVSDDRLDTDFRETIADAGAEGVFAGPSPRG